MAEYHNQSKLRFWCQMVLPLVYDDSLSYMELLNKVVSYLNNCIQDVGNCETNIESLLEAFVNLQDYVNEIGDNIGTIVEDKIDEMVESGMFGDILVDAIAGVIAEEYDPTQSYVPLNYVLYDGDLYCCTDNTTGTFDPTKWRNTSVCDDLNTLMTRVYTLKTSQVTNDSNVTGSTAKDALNTLNNTKTIYLDLGNISPVTYPTKAEQIEQALNLIEVYDKPVIFKYTSNGRWSGIALKYSDSGNGYIIANYPIENGTYYGYLVNGEFILHQSIGDEAKGFHMLPFSSGTTVIETFLNDELNIITESGLYFARRSYSSSTQEGYFGTHAVNMLFYVDPTKLYVSGIAFSDSAKQFISFRKRDTLFEEKHYEFTSSNIINESNVTGTTVTDALNTLANGGMTYFVGANQEYTSFTKLCLDLKNDKSEKTIYILPGAYNIFAEYKALQQSGDLPEVPTSGFSPSTGFAPYNVFIPDNTHVIGLGNVYLNYSPTTSQTTVNESQTISPINVAGSMTLENVTIIGKNCRYCIHDDPLQNGAYANAIKKYKYVRASKQNNDSGYGYSHCVGTGVAKGNHYEYDSCYFRNYDSSDTQRTLYFHDRELCDGEVIGQYESATILVKNCAIISLGTTKRLSVYLGNIGTTNVQIKVDIKSCYISGMIISADESNWQNGTKRNSFLITVQNSEFENIICRNTTNPPSYYQSGRFISAANTNNPLTDITDLPNATVARIYADSSISPSGISETLGIIETGTATVKNLIAIQTNNNMYIANYSSNTLHEWEALGLFKSFTGTGTTSASGNININSSVPSGYIPILAFDTGTTQHKVLIMRFSNLWYLTAMKADGSLANAETVAYTVLCIKTGALSV